MAWSILPRANLSYCQSWYSLIEPIFGCGGFVISLTQLIHVMSRQKETVQRAANWLKKASTRSNRCELSLIGAYLPSLILQLEENLTHIDQAHYQTKTLMKKFEERTKWLSKAIGTLNEESYVQSCSLTQWGSVANCSTVKKLRIIAERHRIDAAGKNTAVCNLLSHNSTLFQRVIQKLLNLLFPGLSNQPFLSAILY